MPGLSCARKESRERMPSRSPRRQAVGPAPAEARLFGGAGFVLLRERTWDERKIQLNTACYTVTINGRKRMPQEGTDRFFTGI